MKTEILTAERAQVEQALGESEQRYRRLLAATTDYIYTVMVEQSRSGTTSHGPGCAAVTGYTSAEFAADPYLWYRVIHPEDRDAVVDQANRILAGDLPPPLEHRIIHKQGGVRWICNTPIPHRDAQGRLVAYDGLIADITSRKRAEMFIAAEHAVTAILVAAPSLAEAWPRVLPALGSTLLWHFAAGWSRAAATGELQLGATWAHPSLRAETMLRADHCRLLNPATCVRRRVATSGQPAWISDAARRGEGDGPLFTGNPDLHGGCLIPLRAEGSVAGVLEVWSREVLAPDVELSQVLLTVGAQLGQFIERQRAQECLEHERQLLRTVVDNLPDCIFVKDPDSRFLLNNVAHLKLLGVAGPQAALGKADQDFFPPDLASRYRADEESVLRTGQSLCEREEPVVDQAGRHYWFLTTKVPLKNGDGKTVGLVGIARDITEHKAAEEKLRESAARLRRSESIAHVGSWELNLASARLTWSDEAYRIFGLTPAAGGLSYTTFLELVHPEDRARVEQAYADSVRDGSDTYEIEHRVIRRSTGEVRVVHEKCEHVRDAAGHIVRSVGMVQDITERKLAADQLEAACARLARRDLILKTMVRRLRASHKELKETQRQLIQAAKLESVGTLAAGVAHEVKNPLQTILLGLHYLAQKLSPRDEDTTLTLTEMREAINRANGIIRELLTLSAATAFEPTPGDLNAVIERSLRLAQNELIAARLKVVRHLSPALPAVLMDAGKLEQVFLNFLINARQAMPAGGTLTVRTHSVRLEGDAPTRGPLLARFRRGDEVVIAEVCDTGTGIAEADLTRVFDPFFTTKPVGVGTGLGLSVARKIVELHAGAIEIRNAPGGGACATVALKAQARNGTGTRQTTAKGSQ